jgi:hypothetical protein
MTFWASAISTSQPSCSSVSWTRRAPVIDSITAQTGSRCTSSMRLARVLSASASGGVASWSSCSPRSESRHTSTFLRLRSNPACNIEVGPPLSSLLGDSRSVSPEGALLHGSPKRLFALACEAGGPSTASSTAIQRFAMMHETAIGVVSRRDTRGRDNGLRARQPIAEGLAPLRCKPPGLMVGRSHPAAY